MLVNSQDLFAPRDEAELAAFVAERRAQARPLRVQGGGSRLDAPIPESHGLLTTRAMSGIVTYEPGELTLIARAGTPVAEIEALLAAEGQALAFEPMDPRELLGSGGEPTIGGVVATNASGPRRVLAGACRDHLLGLRFVDGAGRILKSGGRVMKNVTGMDLARLLCGSFGALGVVTEVALKTLPMAETQKTLVFKGVSAAEAVGIFSKALATPFEVSGAVFQEGVAWLRVEGFARQTDYRRDRLSALFRDRQIETLEDRESRTLWRDLRDLRRFAEPGAPVWRILVKPSEAPALAAALEDLGGAVALDWGGASIWLRGVEDASALRQAAKGGLVFLARGPTAAGTPIFPPEMQGVAALSARLRRVFDPAGIFNPDMMGE